MRHLPSFLAASLLAVAPLGAAVADTVDGQPWRIHVGVHVVDPSSGTGQLAGMHSHVDSSTRPTASIEYMLTPAWSVEALAAMPFRHDVTLDGQRAATAKQLPPVIGVNYHFMPAARVSPFLGIGVNYTHFYDSKGKGILDGSRVELDDSWGIAWHGGVDIAIDACWSVTADVRYIDIDSRVSVDGAHAGTAHVDPWVYGVSIGYRF